MTPEERKSYEARYDVFMEELFRFAESRLVRLPDPEYYRFGPLLLSLQVEGELMGRRLGMAIRHAKTAPPPFFGQMVRVVVIDGEVSGCLPPEWNLPTSERRHLERLHISSDGRRLLHHNPDTTNWTLLDRDRKLALSWSSSAKNLPDWEDSFPLRSILHWMSADSPCCLAHAAVVEKNGVGVLLTGRGGSGKSTTTVAALFEGLRTCGDDFVMVDQGGNQPCAHALYDTVKLDEPALERMSQLKPHVANPVRDADQKARVHLTDTMPQSLIASTPLAAVVQPVITQDQQPSLQPVSAGLVLRALAPTTMFLLRGEERILADKLAALVRILPTWQLRLTQDPRASAAWLGDQLGVWKW
jgi:hypothetical protein